MSTLKKAVSTITSAMQTWTDGIAGLRQQISELTRQRQAIEAAPLPLADVASRPSKIVADSAQIWLEQYRNAFIYGDKALLAASPKGDPQLPWSVNGPMPWGFLCAADPQFAEGLLKKFLGTLVYDAGLPLAERTSVLEKLDKDLANIEAEENALVDEAIEAGLGISHRPEVVQRRADAETKRRQDEYNERRRLELKDAARQDQRARPSAIHESPRSTRV